MKTGKEENYGAKVKSAVKEYLNWKPTKSLILLTVSSTVPLLADSTDSNLSNLVPTSITGSWFWAAAGLFVGAVVAVKGVQIIVRLIRRV